MIVKTHLQRGQVRLISKEVRSDSSSKRSGPILHFGTWCVYTIEAPKDHRVKLSFNRLHIYKEHSTCSSSFLQIKDHNLSNVTM
ncbi:hypothetical protein SK128_007120 [Halocaridina rubra]|uniref:CUB domain-containing protein n=1 Tax=Halocaridina rubra TaxID=373956 RepID=A0AAN9AA99_HALRR